MKDIPVFTTEYGVASLIFKEIPYRGIAYIRIRDVQPGCVPQLIEECAGFCRAAGAERVYAAGHGDLMQYALHCIVEEMTLGVGEPYQPEANLWPVTDETVSRWREIYNEGMKAVDNAATQTKQDEKEICQSGGAYFVHENGRLLGIGWMQEKELLCIVSAVPGQGSRVAKTLFSLTASERITLEVASTNHRAIALYRKLGFIKTGEKARWYQVL